MEGIVIGGGIGDDFYSIFWDNKWYFKVVCYEDKWIVELVILFKSFCYKSNICEWNIFMDCWELKRN